MADDALDKAWEAFQLRKKTFGYDAAAEWMLGHPDYPADLSTATLERAGRKNIKAIRVGQSTLTSNRRRRGVFE